MESEEGEPRPYVSNLQGAEAYFLLNLKRPSDEEK